jgi:hypothetical protein
MKTYLAIAAAAICAVSLTATDASAWQRKGKVTGPYGGTRSVESSGSCSGGSCSYQRSVTGPYGNTRTRQGTITQTEDGWRREGTITRRDGSTVTYGGSGQCSGGSCSYEGGRTGPGGTTTWSGNVSRY